MNLTAAELLPGSGGGYRLKKPQDSQQPVAFLELKTQPQRPRQRLLAHQRHEPGPGGFPEGTAHKVIQPPLPPTLQGARVDLQCFPDAPHTCRLQAMKHCRNQHDHQARVDSASQETHRLRGSPSAAISFGTTKAIASLPLRATARFTIIVGTMQLPVTIKTTLLARLLGQIRIDFLQQLV